MQNARTSANSVPLAMPEIQVEDLETEICLYRPSTDEVLVLNHTAADIWRLIGQDETAGQIVQILARAYQTEPTSIAGDVEATLTDLVTRGFIRWADDETGAS